MSEAGEVQNKPDLPIGPPLNSTHETFDFSFWANDFVLPDILSSLESKKVCRVIARHLPTNACISFAVKKDRGDDLCIMYRNVSSFLGSVDVDYTITRTRFCQWLIDQVTKIPSSAPDLM